MPASDISVTHARKQQKVDETSSDTPPSTPKKFLNSLIFIWKKRKGKKGNGITKGDLFLFLFYRKCRRRYRHVTEWKWKCHRLVISRIFVNVERAHTTILCTTPIDPPTPPSLVFLFSNKKEISDSRSRPSHCHSKRKETALIFFFFLDLSLKWGIKKESKNKISFSFLET